MTALPYQGWGQCKLCGASGILAGQISESCL